LLTILLVAAVCGGLYLLTFNLGNIRAKTLFAFAPAAMLAWLLSRVWSKSQTRLYAAPPIAPDSPAVLNSPVAADDHYTFIGACRPQEADALLAQLKRQEIRFEIDIAKSRVRKFDFAPTSAPLPATWTEYGSANPIKIYVHSDDLGKAESVLSTLGKNLGTL